MSYIDMSVDAITTFLLGYHGYVLQSIYIFNFNTIGISSVFSEYINRQFNIWVSDLSPVVSFKEGL